MQKGWQGNKTSIIEKGARQKVDRLKCVTPYDLKIACQKVEDANKCFERSRSSGKQPDTARVDRAYAYLHALIERANKEGVK